QALRQTLLQFHSEETVSPTRAAQPRPESPSASALLTKPTQTSLPQFPDHLRPAPMQTGAPTHQPALPMGFSPPEAHVRQSQGRPLSPGPVVQTLTYASSA